MGLQHFSDLGRKIKNFSPKLHQPAEFHKSQRQATTVMNRVKDNQKESMMPFSLNWGNQNTEKPVGVRKQKQKQDKQLKKKKINFSGRHWGGGGGIK